MKYTRHIWFFKTTGTPPIVHATRQFRFSFGRASYRWFDRIARNLEMYNKVTDTSLTGYHWTNNHGQAIQMR